MFRYVLALLFIHSYEHSLGYPTNGPYKISDLLSALSSNCKNEFLSSQIKSKVNECSAAESTFNEKQFACLIFYDINHQLCTAANSSTFELTETDKNKLNVPQVVDQLCGDTKSWESTELFEYPSYKSTFEKVFKSESMFMCIKLCGVPDVLSDKSNYFCNYYKWGTRVLQSMTTSTATATNSSSIMQPVISKPGVQVDISKISPTDTELPSDTNPLMNQEQNTGNVNAKSTIGPIVNSDIKSEIPTPISASNSAPSNINDNFGVSIETNAKTSNKSVDEKINTQLETLTNKADNLEDVGKPPKKETDKKEVENKPIIDKNSDAEIPKAKQPVDPDEYPMNDIDSEEGKEGLPDTQGGDDGDDPILDDPDTLKTIQGDKTLSAKRVETPVSSFNEEISQRDMFPNIIQEGFPNDDDNFLPFFMTAVILVVVLYVLYHNKNKMNKMLLGLIVEGRQSNRRRNSRGHAYRRLDTLEQAMSSSTAAPPSKIIY